eukprot:scaffold113_cov96-Isochrysis_galbana.AAC.3
MEEQRRLQRPSQRLPRAPRVPQCRTPQPRPPPTVDASGRSRRRWKERGRAQGRPRARKQPCRPDSSTRCLSGYRRLRPPQYGLPARRARAV